jgi:anti-sigma regulatory factor (Ser/Thr protein kinase)
MAAAETGYEELDVRCLAAPSLAGQARTLIEFRLIAWGLPQLVDSATLVMTELVANAVEAAPDGQVSIRAVRDGGGVLISVWDSSPERPQPRQVKELELQDLDLSPENFDDNGGNGLALVIALATETGFSPTPPTGKWVWARLKRQ